MNVAHYLVAAARSFSDRPAVSSGRELCWKYGEFSKRVSGLAGGLRAMPYIAPGDRVALAMKNCPQYLEVLYATWHAGLCAVPINAKLHKNEFAYILENAGARICFTTPELSDIFHSLVDDLPELRQTVIAGERGYEKLVQSEPLALQAVAPEVPAWLFYTSGTTGRPKGATLTHRSLVAMTLCYYADIDKVEPLDCMIHAAPLSHATGLYAMPHMAKASHHIIPESEGFDSTELLELLQHFDKVTLFAVPTMLMRLVEHPRSATVRTNPPKTLFYGGAPMYVEDLKRAIACFGPCLVQGYGQGEMPNTITYLSKQMHAETTHPMYEARLASVGIPRTGVEVQIVDADGKPLPPGEVGEVVARSDICMTGYWRNNEATASALRDGWLFTGDLGVMDDDGFLTLRDRSKDVIISGGSNIYPREVEEALLHHPGVLEVSVVGNRNAEWGEEVVAFVVRRENHVVTEDELDQTCLDRIARFKRPKRYFFIESLPKSSYGKILKTVLREKLQ